MMSERLRRVLPVTVTFVTHPDAGRVPTDGSWQATVALEPGRSYRYRYLLDGQRWENDQQADRYEPNPLGTVDSVVVVE